MIDDGSMLYMIYKVSKITTGNLLWHQTASSMDLTDTRVKPQNNDWVLLIHANSLAENRI